MSIVHWILYWALKNSEKGLICKRSKFCSTTPFGFHLRLGVLNLFHWHAKRSENLLIQTRNTNPLTHPSVAHLRILDFFCYKSEWSPKELHLTKKARWQLSTPESERLQQPPRLSQTMANASPLSMPFLTILLDLETVSVCASSSTHKPQNFTMTFA